MGCFSPLLAHRLDDGSVSFKARAGEGDALRLACGKCIGCRIDRSKMWAIRCMHESSLYDDNCFITLTYNDEHLPANRSLDYTHFQKFMKRLRKRFPNRKIRFYMAGEYGDQDGRPHFHAILFNFNFDDLVLWKRSGSQSMIYRSSTLEELWPFGFSSVGNVTFQSAAYVARYVMKKISGRVDDINPKTGLRYGAVYDRVDENGEIFSVEPEFNRMSLKPGIAQGWFDKFSSDVYPHDAVILEGGREMRPPKFYDLKMEILDPDMMEAVKQDRIQRALDRWEESSPERLSVKEKVLSSRLSRLKRSL